MNSGSSGERDDRSSHGAQPDSNSLDVKGSAAVVAAEPLDVGESSAGHGLGVTILIPVFNDWDSLRELLVQIDEVRFDDCGGPIDILIVDDCSTTPPPDECLHYEFCAIRHVHILTLCRNQGHQRAIAVGLCFLRQQCNCEYVAVMDGDGEDDPHGIPVLIREAKSVSNSAVVFARRAHRHEGALFKLLYLFYKGLHRALVGKSMAVGNFSVIPAKLLPSVVVISEIWNHYAAGIRHARTPYIEVLLSRAKRLAGHSRMGLVNLITHGLSSIAVYSEVVGTRVILGIISLLSILVALLLTVVAVRLFTDLAVPGWATYTSGLLIILMSQLVLIGMIFSMITLSNRNSASFLPIRDYHHFVANFRRVPE
ncbi:MAG: glycosyltransferase [Chitinivibrionales bacterium]|nr:glycosyltransferase [Chitinivibrionales bacterium]